MKKKYIVPIDEGSVCGTLAYGYSDKNEAIKVIEKQTGEKIENPDDMTLLKVERFRDENGDIIYYWGENCKHCGKPNNGVMSWADFC